MVKHQPKMKRTLTLFALVWMMNSSLAQVICSGQYDIGLTIAYDAQTHQLTGYYENGTGWDEETNSPKFSCIFYLAGTVINNQANILTYYPRNQSAEQITGTIDIISNTTLSIKLPTEHGGCWNVQHFADSPIAFNLTTKSTWTQIRYVHVAKTFFYTTPSILQKQKAYLLQNDMVCIDKTVGEWAYCSYYGDKLTKGWIKIADLNKQ